jgi:hypothetical protein
MNIWEARYKALLANINDDKIIENAKEIVKIAYDLSCTTTISFEGYFYALLDAVIVIKSE